MALLRVAEALCALADSAPRQLADWVEWEPSREASEECSQSRSVNRWRSLLWSSAQFPVLRTLNIPPSTHCQLLFWTFFLPPTFYSVLTFPKAAFCALVGPQAPGRPPPPTISAGSLRWRSLRQGLRVKDGVLTGFMSWWHKRTGTAIFMVLARHKINSDQVRFSAFSHP